MSLFTRVHPTRVPIGSRSFSEFFRTKVNPAKVVKPGPNLISALENGLRITSQPGAGELVTLGVHINAGTRNQETNNGLAYILKKLTLQRPSLRESHGIDVTGFTNRDHISFIVTCSKNNIEGGLSVLADLVDPKKFESGATAGHSSKDLSTEAERRIANNNLEHLLFDHLHSIAYQGSSLAFPVLGSQPATLKEVSQFQIDNYTGPRILLSGVGVDSNEQLHELAKKHFSFLPSNTGKPLPKTRFVGSLANVRDDFLPKVHALYAVEVTAADVKSQLVLQVLQAALGSWDASDGAGSNTVSRLGETIALEHLGDRAQSFFIPYKTTGLLGIYGISNPENLEDFSVEVLSEFVRVATKLSKSEVERAKTTVKAASTRQLSTAAGSLDLISRQIWNHGNRFDFPSYGALFDSIGVDEVSAAASTFLYDADPVIVAMGPTTHLPDYNRLRSWMYWNRL